MKALILNSGLGKRMGALTCEQPKCMTQIAGDETILSRQLRQLCSFGITEIVMTTGAFDNVLKEYCASLDLPARIEFIKNEQYAETNYIYSMYLAKDYLAGDIILMHGDLVFSDAVLSKVVSFSGSCMTVSCQADIPEKDFKAVTDGAKIKKIGIEFFENVYAAQPLYKFLQDDWNTWQNEISKYCKKGKLNCYAEDAFNDVSSKCNVFWLDVASALCNEIDTPDDLLSVNKKLDKESQKSAYMCFSTDVIHSGHIAIIDKAAKVGKLTIGALSDLSVANYKRFPLIPYRERKVTFEHIKGVHRVVEQETLSYVDNIRKYKPDYVVHGDDWRNGFQQTIRSEVINELAKYGGELVEYPYSHDEQYESLETDVRERLSIPDIRRGRLRKLLDMKPLITVIEAHSGITGLIAETSKVYQDGKVYQFDGMWVSSLCDSTARGKPDIELVDMTSRLRTIDEIMDVTTKPIILDGDTGGLSEHFVYTVKTLERLGVSAIIIEDKTGLKKNSLFGTEVEQTQDTIENFCAKIAAGKQAQKTRDFMIIARIESLILERGMEDALTRAAAFVQAGADGIMIHSRKKDPSEIFEFVEKFRATDAKTPIVVVPTSFNAVTEQEFADRGVNIVIYANQLTRSGFPAMQQTANTILTNHRAKEADEKCMSIKDILTLIPSE